MVVRLPSITSMASSMFQDLYEVVGVRGGEAGLMASAREIEVSYRHRARALHPDKNPGNPRATAEFQQLQAAFSILKDAASRAVHDARLRVELDRRRKPQRSSISVPQSSHMRNSRSTSAVEEQYRAFQAESERIRKAAQERAERDREIREIREDAKRRVQEYEEGLKRQQEKDQMVREEFQRFASDFLAREAARRAAEAEGLSRIAQAAEELRAADERHRLAKRKRKRMDVCISKDATPFFEKGSINRWTAILGWTMRRFEFMFLGV